MFRQLKLLSIIILTLSLSSNSFADDSNLILECRMFEGDNKPNELTDIFFENDLNQSFLFKVLKYDKNEIAYKYNNSSTGKYIFNRDTKILTSVDDNQVSNYAICNNPKSAGRQIIESDKNLSWKIKDKYLKPECLSNSNLDVWDSFDNYEEYYTKYLGKEAEDPFEDKEFVNFYKNIGLYLNKEIPLNDKFAPSWNGDWNNNEDILSLSFDLSDCIEQNSTSKVHFDKSTFFFSELKNIKLEDAKVLAPHIKNEFISIKEFKINNYQDDGYRYFFSSIFGILEIDGKLFMVPLKN